MPGARLLTTDSKVYKSFNLSRYKVQCTKPTNIYILLYNPLNWCFVSFSQSPAPNQSIHIHRFLLGFSVPSSMIGKTIHTDGSLAKNTYVGDILKVQFVTAYILQYIHSSTQMHLCSPNQYYKILYLQPCCHYYIHSF